MSDIFASLAPSYWAVGLPAIPLWRNEKRPVPTAWQTYAETDIPDDLKQDWLNQYPTGNIGLALGPKSGLCMIDIDTEDQNLQQVIGKLLPPTPWERRGKKGVMLAYRWTGHKTFRIKNAQGAMIVELLSTRTQCVLPGSIHPETKLPYEADTDLFDPSVLNQLQSLPPDFEAILRSALEAAGETLSLSGHTRVTDYVSRGSRDVTMIAVAGSYVNGVLRGELTFQEAIGRMVAWHSSCVDKIAGDDIDINKGIQKLGEFLSRDVLGPRQRPLPIGWDAGLDPADILAFGFDKFQDENVAWDYDRLKEYIRQAFINFDAESVGRKNAVDYLLQRMANAPIDDIDRERLLKYVSVAGQMGITVATLKKRLAELSISGISGNSHTEIAKSIIKDMEVVGPVAYHAGQFWQWLGSHWSGVVPDPTSPDKPSTPIMNVLLRLIADNYGDMPLAKRAADHKGILTVMQSLVDRDIKQTAEVGINFANGYLTLDLVMRDHHPDYGCTYTLPYLYSPELVGTSRQFNDFMHSCWGGDPDYQAKLDALQEALAVTLFGISTRFERAFCLHGPPKSGKSQLLKIVNNLLPPESISAIPPEQWGDKFLPAQMYGKILNIAGELSERKNIDGTMFKSVISGEVITCQHKHQTPFKFRPLCAHWFATNHVPKTDDTSSAFNRRWLLLTYNHSVSDAEKVLDLGSLIAADEREAIVAWAVEAIQRPLKKTEFTLPASHCERIEEISRINNSLRSFLLDSGKVLVGNLVASSSTPISEIDLFNAYYTFAIAAGVARPVSLPSFRQKMRELGSELGFQIRLDTNALGHQTCHYESITLVPNNVGPMRRRA